MPECSLPHLKVSTTALKNVLLFEPEVFKDSRGEVVEMYNEKAYKKIIKELTGKDVNFVQDSMSYSHKDVLRGIHGDSETWKLVSCLKGKVYVVIINCIQSDRDFGKWQSFYISEYDRKQVLVPPEFGTSYLVLSDGAIFHYKQSTYYNPKKLRQFTYKFDDPRFNIQWPIRNPILSQRDELKEPPKGLTN